MSGPITRYRDIESLKTVARWPGTDRNTTVVLAAGLAAARADGEGYRYFSELAGARPGEALPLALAGFFQARLGEDADAGGRDEQFAAAAAAILIGQSDYALALEIIQPGLLRHPATITLAGLRRTVLHRLMEQYQLFDPFKFLIYAELAGAEIGPVE